MLSAFDFNPLTGVTVDVIVLEVNDARSPRVAQMDAILASTAGMRKHSVTLEQNFFYVRDGFVPISGY